MGIDNILSTLPLPGLDLKRGLLDGLLGMGGSGSPSRGAKSFPKGSPSDGSMFSSFVPLEMNGDATGPKPKGDALSSLPFEGELPLVDEMEMGTPLEPMKGIPGVRGLDGKVKRDHRRLARRSQVCQL